MGIQQSSDSLHLSMMYFLIGIVRRFAIHLYINLTAHIPESSVFFSSFTSWFTIFGVTRSQGSLDQNGMHFHTSLPHAHCYKGPIHST